MAGQTEGQPGGQKNGAGPCCQSDWDLYSFTKAHPQQSPRLIPGPGWNAGESGGRQEVLIVLAQRSRSQTAYESDVIDGRARHIFVLAHRVTKT